MAIQTNTYAAGLKDGKVKLSSGTVYDINAVVSAEADPSQDEIEVKGDDELKATFISNITEELTIVANAITFDAVEAITGNDVSSSATGMEVALGTDSQENPPYVEIQAFAQAKNGDGSSATLKKVWHKVQIYSIKLSMAGEQEFNVEMKGRAYQTATDIEGAALATNRVATVSVTIP